jgi:hypothetical protein
MMIVVLMMIVDLMIVVLMMIVDLMIILMMIVDLMIEFLILDRNWNFIVLKVLIILMMESYYN